VIVLFFKSTFRDRPGYRLGLGPSGKRLTTMEIENAPLPGTLLAHESLPGPKRQTQPTTVERTLSIADLLRGAIRDSDGRAFVP